MATPVERFAQAMRQNAAAFGIRLRSETARRLSDYYELLMRWNSRLHLVAPCSPKEFATRHVLESLMLLPHLTPNARVVDVGSGAGLPIIPCLIARDDLRATLIEPSPKKTVFLGAALRCVRAAPAARIVVARFQETSAPEAEFVTARALNRFGALLPKLIQWAPPDSTLLLFGGAMLRAQIDALLPAARAERIPGSERRFLIIAKRRG